MKNFVLVFLLSCIPLLANGQYHRFYRGFSIAETNMDKFVVEVNEAFFPMFSKAHAVGLLNYRPILLNEEKNLNLPQEIVILTFKDEESYKAYGATEIGKQIRAAHAPLFDSKKSLSLVPTPFKGTVIAETAYMLNTDMADLSKDFSGVLIHSEPYGNAELSLREVEEIFRATGKEKIISLVAANYVVEYLFASTSNELEKLRSQRCTKFKGAYKANKFVTLRKHKIGEKVVNFNEGMDAQW